MNNIRTNTKQPLFLEKINRMEMEIQLLKIESILQWKNTIEDVSIIGETSGILGKEFSRGISFENSLRKGWKERFSKNK